jgi:hypothetical protein
MTMIPLLLLLLLLLGLLMVRLEAIVRDPVAIGSMAIPRVQMTSGSKHIPEAEAEAGLEISRVPLRELRQQQ